MGVDGTWSIAINSPMGVQEATLTLATNGDALSGNMSSPTSPMGDVDITDGRVHGDDLTWKAKLSGPMPVTLKFAATVDGDEITGTVSAPIIGKAKFTGRLTPSETSRSVP